ncbi:MAG: hydroxymethylbilane synthase [Elusimicrobia bacterium]|nr:hydroxymethylbilane synthase [Elusimicrobiota bacterium]
MLKRLRLGTRGSKLALVQSEWVRSRILERFPKMEVELNVIKTSGDQDSSQLISKALFVKEIEEALLRGEVEAGVHSAKDLPAELPSGLEIAAFPPRESPWDVLLMPKGKRTIQDLAVGTLVGTASLRREIQLKALRSDFRFAPIRGNVDTRLKKLESGEFGALVLAEAGLKRLGLRDRVNAVSCREVVPAPGQGALALEVRSDRMEVCEIIASLDHAPTRMQVEAERVFLKRVGGSCRLPLGALVEPKGSGVKISVFWSDLEGKYPVYLTENAEAKPEAIASVIRKLAERVLTEEVK